MASTKYLKKGELSTKQKQFLKDNPNYSYTMKSNGVVVFHKKDSKPIIDVTTQRVIGVEKTKKESYYVVTDPLKQQSYTVSQAEGERMIAEGIANVEPTSTKQILDTTPLTTIKETKGGGVEATSTTTTPTTDEQFRRQMMVYPLTTKQELWVQKQKWIPLSMKERTGVIGEVGGIVVRAPQLVTSITDPIGTLPIWGKELSKEVKQYRQTYGEEAFEKQLNKGWNEFGLQASTDILSHPFATVTAIGLGVVGSRAIGGVLSKAKTEIAVKTQKPVISTTYSKGWGVSPMKDVTFGKGTAITVIKTGNIFGETTTAYPTKYQFVQINKNINFQGVQLTRSKTGLVKVTGGKVGLTGTESLSKSVKPQNVRYTETVGLSSDIEYIKPGSFKVRVDIPSEAKTVKTVQTPTENIYNYKSISKVGKNINLEGGQFKLYKGTSPGIGTYESGGSKFLVKTETATKGTFTPPKLNINIKPDVAVTPKASTGFGGISVVPKTKVSNIGISTKGFTSGTSKGGLTSAAYMPGLSLKQKPQREKKFTFMQGTNQFNVYGESFRQTQGTGLLSKQTTSLTQGLKIDQGQLKIQQQEYIQTQKITSLTQQKTLQRTQSQFFNLNLNLGLTPPTSGIFVPIVIPGNLSIGGFGFGSRGRSKRRKQKTQYAPSLAGIFSGKSISYAPTGAFTGLEIRYPVLSSRKRRKKRR